MRWLADKKWWLLRGAAALSLVGIGVGSVLIARRTTSPAAAASTDESSRAGPSDEALITAFRKVKEQSGGLGSQPSRVTFAAAPEARLVTAVEESPAAAPSLPSEPPPFVPESPRPISTAAGNDPFAGPPPATTGTEPHAPRASSIRMVQASDAPSAIPPAPFAGDAPPPFVPAAPPLAADPFPSAPPEAPNPFPASPPAAAAEPFAPPAAMPAATTADNRFVTPPVRSTATDNRFASSGPPAGPAVFDSPAGSAATPPGGRPAGAISGSGRPGQKTLEGPQAPTLIVEKLVPPEIQVGKAAIFELHVRNVGAVPAHDVRVHDELPQGVQLINTHPRAERGQAGELVWTFGTLRPGEETVAKLEVMPTAEGEIGSVAHVHFSTEASARVLSTRPALRVDVVAPPEVLIGQMTTFEITVTNPGTGVATGVVLTEHVPAGLEHEAGTELEYEVGNLQPGDTRTLTLSMKAMKAGPAVNVLSAQGDAQLVAEQKTQVLVTAPAIDLVLDGPRRRYLDRQATYTLSVSNTGTAPAEEVELVTYLPPGMEFVEANNQGQYDSQTRSVHWLLEELPPRERGSVTLTALPIETGEQPLRIAGTARLGLAVEKQEMVIVEGVAALLFQLVDVADPVEMGSDTTYEIRVLNQGTKAATNVQVVAILPPELKPLAAEGPTQYDVSGQQVRFHPLARLAPKADTTYRVRVQGIAPGDLRTRVQLMSDDIRTPITKEESTRVYSDKE